MAIEAASRAPGHPYRRLLEERKMPEPSRSELSPDYFNRPLAEVDPEVAAAVQGELRRQQDTLEMIASENFVPRAVLECAGSVLTNKYAEGYPGRRYYGGCEQVDISEQLAIDRAKALFGAEHANVQPHAGAQANTAVYQALLNPGEKIMGLSLAHGGHLTHGMKLNVSGKLYEVVPYETDPETGLVDMDEVARLAREHRPKLLLAGWSAYPRQLDFQRFREIADEVGAPLMVDMAHFAGLVAAGLHPNPVQWADVVTSTTHKTLGGPRAGLILCKEELRKKIDSAVFPGQQGGPLQHVIAAKAVALKIAASELFRERQERTLEGAKAVAEQLLSPASEAHGIRVLTGGTDVHLLLVDLRLLTPELSGRQAEDRLHEIGVTVNRNAIPFDPRPPLEASGIRIGTPALATRGLQHEDFSEVGAILATALTGEFEARRDELAERVQAIVERYPLYEELRVGAPA
jgi:glycine hydroxymethyltransferase